MSDPPPQRPKPGSLRDRIAAFEQKPAASASSSAPPAPRPKPGGLAKWAPKPPSPPASPTSSATATVQREGGMSARDAQASIGQGGTLKERMAALQGMAAFGGAAAPAPPKPAQEKPKWKPPPQVAVAPPIRDDEEDSAPEHKAAEEEEAVPDKVSVPSATAEDDTPTPGAGESTEPESNDAEKGQDPEDEERQRRAAIAARMARLGGARVGMAPPVFGKKPVPAKEQKPVEQTSSGKEDAKPDHGELDRKSSMDAQSSSSPPATSTEFTKVPSIHSTPEAAEGATSPKPQTFATPDYLPSSSTSASPPSADSADSQSAKSPSSMPVPSVPRRALPPRKKTPKTPSTPAMPEPAPEPTSSLEPTNVLGASVHVSPSAYGGESSVTEAQATASGDRQEEVGNVNASAEDYFDHSVALAHDRPAVVATASTEIHDDPIAEDDVAEAERATSPSSDARPESPDDPEVYLKPKRDIEPEPAHDPELAVEPLTPLADAPSEDPAGEGQRSDEVEDEEDEAARRQRIAQRLAQMGGVNPLSAPREPSPEHEETGDVPRKSSLEAAPGNRDSNVPVHNFEPTSTPSEPRGSTEGVGLVRKTVGDEITEDDSIIREEHVGSDNEGQPPTADPIHRQGEHRIQGGAVRLEGEDEHEALRDEIDRDGQNETLDTRGEHGAVAGADETAEDVMSDGEEERADGEQVQDAIEDNKDVPDSASNEAGHTREQRTAPVHPGDTPAEEDAAGPRYDEGFEASGDDNDMAPPRILRPLPAAPAAPTPVLSTRPDTGSSITRESPPSFPSPSPNRRVSVPPPLRSAPASNVPAAYEPASPRIATTKRASMPPPVRAVPQPAGERAVLSPPPVPAPFVVASEEVVEEPEEDSEEPHVSPSPSPPPPPPRRSSIQASAPPTPRKPSLPGSLPQSPRVPVSWTASSQHRRASRESTSSYGERRPSLGFVPPPPPVPQVAAASPPPLPRSPDSPSVPVRKLPPTLASPQDEEHEVLDDSDGDPIDPRFHSPLKSSMLPSVVAPPPTALPPPIEVTPFTPQSVPNAPSPQEDSEEDAEQVRRRTIAERMAKLGGIRFGAPPAPALAPARRPPASAPSAEELPDEENTPMEQGTSAPQVPGEEDEEDEQARRQRITAKLAGMGGMRFGMIPGASPVPNHPSPAPKREEPTPTIPSRAIPPARQHQPPADPESEAESNPMSDDGVQVEAEESEAEEVLYEDALEDEYVEQAEEEELPPPPPSRSARPPIPTGRPPVPPPVRKPSIDTPPSPVVPLATRPTRKDSYDTVTSSSSRLHARAPQSDYVMVEQEDEESPPPPPRRPSRAQPSSLPHPAMVDQNDTSSQWELPSIPTGGLDFGENSATSDLSTSILSEDSTYYPPPPAEKPLPPTIVPPSDHAHTLTQMSAEELRALWGRVGVQICEVATTLHERSKKTLIGDGSYAGFVAAVLAQVPNAQQPPMDGVEYGYLVYAQSGASVHTRASEIMPGDIIVLEGAKLKGHKGLHAYTTVAGEGAPCIGVVCEFETKKLKVRSLQANQHVGQATVESVSYKLEDLKSGLIKVYRALEA